VFHNILRDYKNKITKDVVERVQASFLHSPEKSTGTAANLAPYVENKSVEGSV
jgi:hypothetical protein